MRKKCRASPVLLFWRAGRVVSGTVGIVRATVPFHGEHDAPEPTKDGLRFSTVRLPTPRCVCVSVNLFSLSLSLRLLRLCVLLLRDPLVQAGVGCRRRARSRSRLWLSKTSARWSALWPGAASAGGVAGVLAGGSAGLGDGGKGGRWGPASARGGPGVSSIPESSQCVRVVFPGPAPAGAGRRLAPCPIPTSHLSDLTDAHLEDLAAGDTLVLRKQTPISRTWQPAYRAH